MDFSTCLFVSAEWSARLSRAINRPCHGLDKRWIFNCDEGKMSEAERKSSTSLPISFSFLRFANLPTQRFSRKFFRSSTSRLVKSNLRTFFAFADSDINKSAANSYSFQVELGQYGPHHGKLVFALWFFVSSLVTEEKPKKKTKNGKKSQKIANSLRDVRKPKKFFQQKRKLPKFRVLPFGSLTNWSIGWKILRKVSAVCVSALITSSLSLWEGSAARKVPWSAWRNRKKTQ